jgi:hypothetical protein
MRSSIQSDTMEQRGEKGYEARDENTSAQRKLCLTRNQAKKNGNRTALILAREIKMAIA